MKFSLSRGRCCGPAWSPRIDIVWNLLGHTLLACNCEPQGSVRIKDASYTAASRY